MWAINENRDFNYHVIEVFSDMMKAQTNKAEFQFTPWAYPLFSSVALGP